MELYTLKQADYLIQYYSDMVIGRIFEESTQSKIGSLKKVPLKNGEYRVMVISKRLRGNIFLQDPIDRVSKRLNLPLPLEILEEKNLL